MRKNILQFVCAVCVALARPVVDEEDSTKTSQTLFVGSEQNVVTIAPTSLGSPIPPTSNISASSILNGVLTEAVSLQQVTSQDAPTTTLSTAGTTSSTSSTLTYSPSSVSSGNPGSGSAGVSTGMAAGIGIGCAVLGFVLFGVVVWWCMPTKRKVRSANRGHADVQYQPMNEKKDAPEDSSAFASTAVPEPPHVTAKSRTLGGGIESS